MVSRLSRSLAGLRIGLILALIALFGGTAFAQRFETRVPHAILIDLTTGTVLFQKDPDERMPPASLAKLMTAAVVFTAIREGQLSFSDEFVVSENAWRTGGAGSGGSTMFAKLGSSIRVEDLVRGMIIQSGNDACIVIAEGMAGTERTFADLMNQLARKVGLTGSHFTNSTGLPDPAQYVTARDLSKLATYIITEFPEYYRIYGEGEFTWNKIRQRNRNPLLEMNIGADGLKTGFTEEAGYGLVGSAVRDGQRLLVVLSGAKTEKERAEEGRKLLEWGFRAFERVSVFGNGEVIAEAKVFNGEKARVGLVSKGPLELLLPVGSRDQIKAEVVYEGPVPAPIDEGQPIGTLKLTTAEGLTKDAPLYAATDVAVGSLDQRALDGVEELLFSWWPGG